MTTLYLPTSTFSTAWTPTIWEVGGDQGRGAQFLAGLGHLGVDLVQTVQGLVLLELADQVGDHAARDLVDQDARCR